MHYNEYSQLSITRILRLLDKILTVDNDRKINVYYHHFHWQWDEKRQRKRQKRKKKLAERILGNVSGYYVRNNTLYVDCNVKSCSNRIPSNASERSDRHLNFSLPSRADNQAESFQSHAASYFFSKMYFPFGDGIDVSDARVLSFILRKRGNIVLRRIEKRQIENCQYV